LVFLFLPRSVCYFFAHRLPAPKDTAKKGDASHIKKKRKKEKKKKSKKKKKKKKRKNGDCEV
jgi:hypothetical protein